MIAMERRCLAPDELQDVLSGRLESKDFEVALSHLDQCEQCRLSADSIQQNQPWIVDTLAGEQDPLQSETDCQIALWQILESGQSFNRSEPDSTSQKAASTGLGSSESQASSENALPLQTLGPYELKHALGTGGMGTVYLAEHVRLQRPCAIKILPRERVDQPGWLERFDREMTTVAALEHEHVVRATDAGHQDGWHYLVMEYLDGLDVGRIASRMEQIEIADACEIVRQAALGLAHIHRAGLVHRDIKPSNLMLPRSGKVKLLDLGLVLSGDDPLSVSDRLTTVGHLMGTMPYMAPEQLRDSRDVTASADIYSLGATLYRLITGRPPHGRQGGLANQVMAITERDAPPLDELRPDVDADLVTFTKRLLARDPQARPSSADEVASTLERFGGGQLKRLVRQAERKADHEPSAHSAAFLVTQAQSDKPNWTIGRLILLATAFLVATALAGFSLVVATDRGELTIHSDLDDVAVSIHQGDKVVENLTIQRGRDNSVTLRKGSYRIEIDNAPLLTLSENRVNISRGSRETIQIQRSAAQRLFKGKDLNQWMSQLTREEEPISLGEIMNAVEVLTRDTPERAEAAATTLATSRLWGGIAASNPNPGANGLASNNPSQHYMYYLNETFPRYGEEGLGAIDRELDEGNRKSRIASIWMLTNIYQPGMRLPPGLLSHLEDATKSIEDRGSDRVAANMGRRMCIRLAVDLNQDLTSDPWLVDCVTEKVQDAIQSWKNWDTMQGFTGGNPWVPDEPTLLAAVSLAEAGKLELDWNWLADALTHSNYQWESERSNDLFDAVKSRAPETLQQQITQKIEGMQTPVVDSFSAFQAMRKDQFWSSQWIPAFDLGSSQSIWPKALQFYASEAPDPQLVLKQLSHIKEVMVMNGADPKHASKPMQYIDAAIETLEKR